MLKEGDEGIVGLMYVDEELLILVMLVYLEGSMEGGEDGEEKDKE